VSLTILIKPLILAIVNLPMIILDRLSKCLSPCPAAEQPHWLRQPLARYGFHSGLRNFLATEAAALAGSK
jgi:hypothetical protein